MSDPATRPAAPGAQSAPSPTTGLREVVLNDDQRFIGVPMVLHTQRSLAESGPAVFSTEGYLRQARLGRELLTSGRLARAAADQAPAALLAAPVVSLNFHGVPVEVRGQAEERIRRLLDLGGPFDPERAGEEPQVLVAFYDGDRETGLWGAELCRRLGVRAYFFPLLADAPPPAPTDRLDDGQLAGLVPTHELCFHTASHRAAREVTGDDLAAEVLEPVDRLTRLGGRVPRLAAWRGGARFDPETLGDRTIRELGLGWLVSNWSIEPIEPIS